MSSAPSTDLENPSEISTWIVLVCSGLALVMFFGWIVKDLSAIVSPKPQNSLIVQPLSETAPVSDGALENATSVIETASGQPINRIPSGSNLSEVPASASTRIVATQEGLVSTEKFSDTESGTTMALSARPQGDVSPSDSIARTSKTEQATEGSTNTTPSNAKRPPADLGDLRQLLAEAAAIADTGDVQARAERKQSEALRSLGILSEAIQFAPGSKSVNEAMSSSLMQIEQILADYPETMINVIVATNESGDNRQDMLLSQERGRTLIARFVNEGLSFSRLSLKALTDEKLPANSHRIEIQAYSRS